MDQSNLPENLLDDARNKLEHLSLWHDRINGGLDSRAKKLEVNMAEIVQFSDIFRKIRSRIEGNCQALSDCDAELSKAYQEGEKLRKRLEDLDKENLLIERHEELKENTIHQSEEEIDKELEGESHVKQFAQEDLVQLTENKSVSSGNDTVGESTSNENLISDPEIVRSFWKVFCGRDYSNILEDLHSDLETAKKLLKTEKALDEENAKLRCSLRQRMHELMSLDVQTFLAEYQLRHADTLPTPTKVCERFTDLLSLQDDLEGVSDNEEMEAAQWARHDAGISLHRCKKVTDLSLILKSEIEDMANENESILAGLPSEKNATKIFPLENNSVKLNDKNTENTASSQEVNLPTAEKEPTKKVYSQSQVGGFSEISKQEVEEGKLSDKEKKYDSCLSKAFGSERQSRARETQQKSIPGPSADFLRFVDRNESLIPEEKLNRGLMGTNLRKRSDSTRSPSSTDLAVGGVSAGTGKGVIPAGAMALCKQSSAKSAEPPPSNARFKRSSFK